MRVFKLLFAFVLGCWVLSTWSNPAPIRWYKQNDQQIVLKVDLFLSTTCPHCRKADEFFNTLVKEKTWLEIQRHYINEDKAALDAFSQFLKQGAKGVDDYAVPAIFFCDSRWTGFDEAKTTGKKIIEALTYCRQQIEKEGELTPATVKSLQQWATASWYENNIVNPPSAGSFIPMMAFIDAISPCSIFGLFALISFLFLQKTPERQWALGVFYLALTTLTHYFQQANTALYYKILPFLMIPAAIVGVLLLLYVVEKRLHPSARTLFKGMGVFFGLALVAGVLIQSYQQNCAPNFALIFQQWLIVQPLSSGQRMVYVLIYHLVYFFSLSLLVLLIMGVLKQKWADKHQAYLRDVAFIILAFVGAILLAYPSLLAKLLPSFIVIIIAFVGAWIIKKLKMDYY
ncbi:glutaredoxin family protein [Legionella taurinensis]|uniref:Thioredoxin domain-containing protein n=1 Tax=Legionella taurinensis TaxID=70611 RepID=A0A3A5LG47_9GAMM|nr:hypothetical protein [Legionella taurinensis]RJT47797.1 hypothetical protein D6J04_06595 [Legionella taurinensis]RJT67796.1 hypothetical protein D6J03_06285 [Legionella taurinensis]STY25772.1 Uncharacterised protein [Legionella taurinensis]